MKKIVLSLLAVFMLQTAVFAVDYSLMTKNPQVANALSDLEYINKRDVLSILSGNNATGRPMRLTFREIAIYGYGNCEAVTMNKQDGGRIIFINKKNEAAPSEAVACLIAHESQHHPMSGTLQEEIKAWIQEAMTWNIFVRNNPSVAQIQSPLVKRLNYLGRIYNEEEGPMKIQKIVMQHPAYSNLH